MNKQEIFNHFSIIIDEMLDNSLFFDMYFQRPFGFSDMIDGNDYEELPARLLISSGATRTCLIDQEYDWVVKFDIEEDALGSPCQREVEIYNASKAYALERYFAEVIYLGTYTRTINFYNFEDIEQNMNFFDYDPDFFEQEFMKNEEKFGPVCPITISIPLYAYRKAEGYDCGPVDHAISNLAEKVASPLRSRNIAVATAFIREYGMDEYKIFSQFSLEWDINDLHLNNIGEIDGHFAIIDYSGYHSPYYENSSEENWKKGNSYV